MKPLGCLSGVQAHSSALLGMELRVARLNTAAKAMPLLKRGSKTTDSRCLVRRHVPAHAKPGHNLRRLSGVTVLSPYASA